MSAPSLKLRGAKLQLPSDAVAVPVVNQTADYSCGAAALLAVLQYWNVDAPENESGLREALGTTVQAGTDAQDMLALAQSKGLDAQYSFGMNVDDLQMWCELGDTAIVDLQAWADDEEEYEDGASTDGHYVVVVAVDDENVYFMDPSLEGAYSYLPHHEFVERWHDVDTEGEYQHKPALWISGEQPSDEPPTTRNVERMG